LILNVHDNKVKKILDDPKKIIKKIGSDRTKMLKKRFNQLRATNNFKEYLDIGIGKPHPLTCNLNNLYGIHLDANYRLVVQPITESFDDDSLRKCKTIDIKGVLEYHDGKCEWLIP